jgi:branched-chain amino acid transport system ATP-binding protein
MQGLVAGYGSLTILNGLDLDARAGEITLLIGPNGAGKSTALKTFFGLLKPSAGRMTLDGGEVAGLEPAAMLARGVCFVPQGRNLFPFLSVFHNLELGAATLPKAERPGRIEEVVALSPICAAASAPRPPPCPVVSRSSWRSPALCCCARGCC